MNLDVLKNGRVENNAIICSIHSVDDTDGTLIQIPFGDIESFEPNEHGNGFYITANNIHYQVTDYLISGNIKHFRPVTYDDFYISTIGTFVECDIPNMEPNFVSVPRKESDTPSKYWYGEDEKGKYVIRSANHWCNYYVKKEFVRKQQNRIIKCKWHLTMDEPKDLVMNNTYTGKIYLRHLIQK